MAKTKQNSNSDAFNQALMEWNAPRYLRYERTWLWFVCLFVTCFGFAFYGYLTNSITMEVAFAILPLVLILEHRKKPSSVKVTVSEYGIRFGELVLPYSSIQRFWIIHNPPFVNELHLETDSKVHKEYVIQLMDLDPTKLRQFLVTQVLEWEGKHLSFLETVTRLLRLN